MSELTAEKIDSMVAAFKTKVAGAPRLDVAAQILTDVIYDELSSWVALARVYATIPYGRLPPDVGAFVNDLAKAKGIAGDLRDSTPVLTLIGTRGSKPDWNDRRTSQGHKGIPLTSAAFVDAIPMISRLLTELGVDLAWVDREGGGIAAQSATLGVGGVFYVEDASTGVDRLGRNVIPARDFVSGEGIKTVFGAGVTYVDGMLATLILFCRKRLERDNADLILPLVKTLKLVTTVTAVQNGQLLG
jgi:hypothetical protein